MLGKGTAAFRAGAVGKGLFPVEVLGAGGTRLRRPGRTLASTEREGWGLSLLLSPALRLCFVLKHRPCPPSLPN